MRILTALMLFTVLTACTDQHLGASLSFGSEGVSVSPTLSGRVGGALLSISG
jgi:hypothetical protein